MGSFLHALLGEFSSNSACTRNRDITLEVFEEEESQLSSSSEFLRFWGPGLSINVLRRFLGFLLR